MRIYELAQQKNISSKNVIELLQKNGFDVKSHMSVLSDQALSFLEKNFNKKHDNEEFDKKSSVKTQPVSPIEKTVSETSTSSSPIKEINKKIIMPSKEESAVPSQAVEPLLLTQ